MVRQGLRTLLTGYPELTIVGEAENGEEAISAVEQSTPDVVVMDLHMPILNGLEATITIKGRHPDMAVIGLSVNADAANEQAMLKAGAACLLTKEAAVDQLYSAIMKTVGIEIAP
jgi:DNA-binding NarL/FixJ family response regulator